MSEYTAATECAVRCHSRLGDHQKLPSDGSVNYRSCASHLEARLVSDSCRMALTRGLHSQWHRSQHRDQTVLVAVFAVEGSQHLEGPRSSLWGARILLRPSCSAPRRPTSPNIHAMFCELFTDCMQRVKAVSSPMKEMRFTTKSAGEERL